MEHEIWKAEVLRMISAQAQNIYANNPCLYTLYKDFHKSTCGYLYTIKQTNSTTR